MMWGIRFRLAAVPLCSLAAVALLGVHTARADELKLKDGSKITGTIVGFEENSFKVKTSYGFAVVQKDQVVSINVKDVAAPAPEKQPEPAAAKAVAPEKPKPETVDAPPPAIASMPAQPAAAVPKPVISAPMPAVAKNPARVPAPAVAPPAMAASSLSPASSSAANIAPPPPPAPEPIREEVTGNTYTNETYRFHMYKPPDWEVIAAARALLPGAIAAMGTDDDTTYLLIGQQPPGKSIATDMDAAEHRLRDVMDNFRPLGEERITVAGGPATEHHFRGSVDQHDWSGVVVLVPRGPRLYTIFGMTRADSDLVQIQENVIARAISSLQFTEQ